MEDPLTVIYVAGSAPQAHMLKNLLAERGIEATITNQTLERGAGVEYIGWQTLPRVLVDPKDAALARQIALEHDRRGVEMAQSGPFDYEASDDESPRVPETWPRCPQCGARRITRCPICQTTGVDFPEADDEYIWGMGLDEMPDEGTSCNCGGCRGGHGSMATSGEEEADDEDAGEAEAAQHDSRLVLTCPTCSEPFLPEFPRLCAWCGHEFDEGFDPKEIVQPLAESNGRVVAMVLGLLVLAAAAVVYFLVVLRGDA